MCNATLVWNRRVGMANYVESQLSAPIPNIDHRANCSMHFVMPPAAATTAPGNVTAATEGEMSTERIGKRDAVGGGGQRMEQQQQQQQFGGEGNAEAGRGAGKTERWADNDADNINELDPTMKSAEENSSPWDRLSEAANSVVTTTLAETNTNNGDGGTTAATKGGNTTAAQQVDMDDHAQECAGQWGADLPNGNNNGQPPSWISLFPDNDYARYIVQGQFRVTSGFYYGPWKQLLSLIRQYMQHYRQLLMWTGPVFDHNHNGIADPLIFNGNGDSEESASGQLPPPSHIFVILLRCSNNTWHSSGRHCEQPERTKTLAFVLPVLEKDLNCLFPVEYIFRHTARIRDIELLTGNEWFTDRELYPAEVAIQLRTQINEQLWQLEVHS